MNNLDSNGHRRWNRRPVDNLLVCIGQDILPNKTSPSYFDYGFVNCLNDSQEAKLLGLYIGLINGIQCDTGLLHEAAENGVLKDFIQAEFERNTEPDALGLYYAWFLQNTHIVANKNSPEVPCQVCKCICSAKCSNCKQVGYCSRGHQAEHWKIHKIACFPVQIKWNVPGKTKEGAVLVATRAIKQGEIIIREKPLVSSPYLKDDASRTDFPVCLGCHSIIGNNGGYSCSKCKWPVCSKECEQLEQHAQWDCNLFSTHNIPPFAYHEKHYYISILVLRSFLKKIAKSEIKTMFGRMNASELLFYPSGFAIDLLQKTIGLPDNMEDTIELIDEVDTNRRLPENYVSNKRELFIYGLSGLTDHNCIPNSMWVVQADGSCVTRASIPIQKGEIISTSETELGVGTKERQAFLKLWGINCRCKRCVDPTECGTMMSAVTCPKCKSGYLLPQSPLEFDSAWSCGNCSESFDFDFVDRIVADLAGKVDRLIGVQSALNSRANAEPVKVIQAIEALVKASSATIVHPNHYLVCRLKIAYTTIAVQLTPSLDQKEDEDERNEMEERMADWIHEYLAQVNVFWPGYSRFRGEVLYGLQRIMFCLLFTQLEQLGEIGAMRMGTSIPILINTFKQILEIRKEVQVILGIEAEGSRNHALAVEMKTEQEDFACIRRLLNYHETS